MAIEKNNKVTIEYEGRFNDKDGEIFDTSEGKQPLTFITGIGMVVPGFDSAVLGMEKNQEKEITLKPEQAYGERKEELQQKIPREVLPKDQTPEKGMVLIMATPEGQQMPAQITDVTDKEITIDINHPLAGKTLYFKIKVKDYGEFNQEELQKMMQLHKHEHSHECSCNPNDPCQTSEEECKCNSKESSIEDIAKEK